MFWRVLLLFALFFSSGAQASLPLEASLSDLACGADHFLVGRVVGVDMVDGKGRLVRDEKEMTGPGLKTTIRLHVKVIEVIESTASRVPTVLKVPLDPFMHYSLGQIRSAHAEPSEARLVFLQGVGYKPVVAGRFFWGIDARDEAVALRNKCRP